MKNFILSLLTLFSITGTVLGDVALTKQEDGSIVVTADGKPFTTFIPNNHNKPILYPLIGPTGAAMTRQYPVEEALPTEKVDHPHQRSCWFAAGDVNRLSYWHQEDSFGKRVVPAGHILPRKVEIASPNSIVMQADWVDTKGAVDLTEDRTMTFYATQDQRWIDFTITLTAQKDSITFGDTKEGLFAVRVAGTIKVDAKQGGKIVSSEGLTNGEAWGKPASWVDYNGPVGEDKRRVGIAIMNRPDSFGYPTHWHVREYGLFAANPFGLKDFYGSKSGKNGSVTIKKGESITFQYRILLHDGDEKTGRVEQNWEEYCK